MARIADDQKSCPGCGAVTQIEDMVDGVCKPCNEAGIWVDPAGGTHNENEEGFAGDAYI